MPVPAGIVAAIDAGATIVTPSPQRAAALREAWARRQLSGGRRVWATPDILPFDAYAERCLREQAEDAGGRRPLSAVEQQLLWRQVVASMPQSSAALLSGPGRLAEALRRADGLMRRHAIPAARLRGEASPETRWLLDARDRVEARLDRQHARLHWSDETIAARRPGAPAVRLAGFTDLAPAQRRFLDDHGVEAGPWIGTTAAAGAGAVPLLYPARHPADELEQLARWCRERLDAEPRARLLVVVPDLDARRELVQRALLSELDPQAIAAGRTTSPTFALEGGAPLLAEPRVAADIARLERLIQRLERDRWLAWLRSTEPGFAGGGWRVVLERRLLDWQGEALDFASLVAQAGFERGALPGPLARMARAASLLAARSAPSDHWARAFDRALGALEQQPRPLDSVHWQMRERWCRLLEDYASASALVGPVAAGEALDQLRSIAERTRFAPASPDVAVLVTASTADPVVDYDGIWIAGLHDGAFPRPVRIDGFVPAALQRAAGMVDADPRALLGRAEREFAAWRARTGELVVSWAREDGGAEQAVSPLLRAWPVESRQNLAARPSMAAADWLRRRPPAAGLERWRDPAGLPVPEGALVEGGAALLQSANQCAFRGYAEWRLAARAAEKPESGIGALLRGKLLHDALESLWQLWEGQEGLRSADAGSRRAAIAAAVEAAARRHGRGLDGPVAQRAVGRELARAARLMEAVIECELARPPFAVLELEAKLTLALDGFSLRCRIDRVDQLADGSLAVIDYKTGRAVPTDWNGERPDAVQMIAYRAAVADHAPRAAPERPRPEVSALGYLQLSEGRVGYRGVARDRAAFGAALRQPVSGPDWLQRTAAWDAHLQWLARRVRTGEATVEPHATVCRHCELSLLCRRAEHDAALAIDADAPEPAGAEVDDESGDGS